MQNRNPTSSNTNGSRNHANYLDQNLNKYMKCK